MFQKKLNLTPLGPGLPKIQVCVAIQKISSPPPNVPLPLRVSRGCLQDGGGMLDQTFRGCFACLQPQTSSVAEKCFLGQPLKVSELLKLLFNLLCSLKSTLRTHHAAGKAANKYILQLLSGFGSEISQKKAQPHLPQPASSSVHGNGDESTAWLFGAPSDGNRLSPHSPNTGGF